MTRHHLIPKERKRNGSYKKDESKLHLEETLKLWRDKHNYWHFLFKNMTLDEIIKCLQRIKSLKLKNRKQYEKEKNSA